MNRGQRIAQMRLRVLEHAKKIGNVRATCHYFGVSKSAFYNWKTRYDEEGEAGLINKPPIAKNHLNKIPDEIVNRVLHLRTKYHLGPIRIVWYMARYHGIKISDATVSRIQSTGFKAL